ncbi:MAG TPA: M48 family metallopeptidase [Burkholderiales bacterium]|nr:M48 family metallopeptidase [Burkholderiales bacterium]
MDPAALLPNALTWTFVAALALATATRLWLARRQMQHVAAHRAAVPAPFSDTIPLHDHQKAADYTLAKARFGMLGVAVEALLALGLTVGGGLQALSDLGALWLAPGSLLHGTALLLSLFLVQGLVGLPLSAWRIFVIEQRFGFNRMTVRLFLADLVKQTLIGLALGVPLLLALLWLMAQAGPAWWLYAWLVVVAFTVFVQMLVPTVILPLFNKFTPLPDGVLKEKVAALLARTGFQSKGLFVMDGSKRSSHGNAFFAGFGRAKRIVLFDTLVTRLQPAEVEAVLAHELGHYKLRHILKGMALTAAMTFAMLFLLGVLLDKPWFYAGLGVREPGTAAALALLMIVLPEFTYFLHPLLSMFSRKNEYEADAYATRFAGRADLVNALVALYKDNAATLTPDPLHSAFYDSHPPAALRIARLQRA